MARPASLDRARIVFDCRMADDPAMMSLATPTYEKTKQAVG